MRTSIAALALLGLVDAKTAIIIDEQRIGQAVQTAEVEAMDIASKPEIKAMEDALTPVIEQSMIKADIGSSKIMKPVFEQLASDLDLYAYGDECKVHKFYKCLTDKYGAPTFDEYMSVSTYELQMDPCA